MDCVKFLHKPMRHKFLKTALHNKSLIKSFFADKILVKKVKKGNKEAFGSLYKRHLDSIYRYVFFRVRKDQKVAEDITQSVFFRALEKIDTFDEEGVGFRPWIYKIAHNSVIDYYRKYKNQTGLTETLIDESQNVEEKTLKDFEVQNVLNALDLLSDEQRQVIIMRFVSGLSGKETAKALGKNEEAIRSMQYRALKTLRKILNNNE